MAIPIVVTTYERPKYLYQTLDSLIDSTACLESLIIYDDCSQSEEKKKYLCEIGQCDIVVRKLKNEGPYRSMRNAITLGFELDEDQGDVLAYLQDDIECNKHWLDTGLKYYREIEKDHPIGILSLYNRKGQCEKNWYQMESGHPGGVAWLVSRAFWKKYIEMDIDTANHVLRGTDARARHGARNLGDYKICKAALDLGFELFFVGRSLVQHVGDKSTLTDKDMTYVRSQNYVGRD